ncbi:MAG: hypothetical protein LBG47_01015 [Prevotellaceae bacterium]|jgi:hypothetical protein|nr:hypothetical protein [Prevotellaceae bacterium]
MVSNAAAYSSPSSAFFDLMAHGAMHSAVETRAVRLAAHRASAPFLFPPMPERDFPPLAAQRETGVRRSQPFRSASKKELAKKPFFHFARLRNPSFSCTFVAHQYKIRAYESIISNRKTFCQGRR